MQNTFIRRPVLSIVISILLVLLGGMSLSRLPMALFPSVAPPEVNVTIEYTGANAETVTKAALVPLERAINGVPRMKYMSSDAGNDGVGVVQILFETGTDPDVAAVNVQNRVNSVMGELPEEVIRNGVKIAKEENAMLMYLSVTSDNPEHDEKFLYNFTDINVLAELKRINGVGYAELLGAKRYAMRVWLKPDKMLTYGISTDDVLDALRAYNVEAAPGKIGENSDKGGAPLQYTVKYTGKFSSEAEYGSIPLKTSPTGTLRLKDVAEIELGTTYFDVEAKLNGKPAASLLLKQLPGSNAREVITAVKERMQVLQQEAFLPGMAYDFSFDVSRFLDASVREVLKTCLEAFALVALVVFLFLQDLRSTLIPIVAVPVSLIGTFFFIQFLGFSLNLITLFALVLAIGIVVDDAIVVVEAVHHKMQHTGLPPLEATEQSMAEIRPAIIAITLVMASVFLPVAFVSGPAGVFYRQFSLTMAIAIVLSGVVALTLTPALCAALLRPASPARRGGLLARFFGGFNAVYGRAEHGYGRLLGVTARRGVLTLGLLGAFAFGVIKVAGQVPAGFIPEEDQGVFYASVTAPPGATLERTKEVMNAIQKAAQGIEGVESVATLAGTNVLSDGTGATYGTSLVNLVPWEKRTRSSQQVMDELQRRIAHVKDADIELFPPPSVPGYGNASGFELRLLDKTGRGDLTEMDGVVQRFMEDLKARPEIGSAFSIFDASFPQYTVRIDMDRAAQKGVRSDAALGTLQTLLGSEYATNFIRFGQMYKVMVQALPEYRSSPEQLLQLTTKNDAGDLVPLSSFMSIEKSYGVDQITRYNMYPSAELNGDGKPGVSSGNAIRAVLETAKEKLPRGYGIDWAGITRDEVSAGNQGALTALVCLVFVFLVLAAQYDSFILPLAVVLSLVPGLLGSFGLLSLMGLENNIYTHIAVIVLIGLLGKNAILIVEFAELKVADGLRPLPAVIEAARQRLRPILMTSLAFVAGLMPLVLANGAGAIGNKTIGAATAGGMALGTVWGLVLVPGLYVLCKALSARLRGMRPVDAPPSAPPPPPLTEDGTSLASPAE